MKNINTTLLRIGACLTLLNLLNPASMFADGISTSIDNLTATTLESSAYTLTDITSYISDSDLDSSGTYIGDNYDFVIKKYIDNNDGTYTTLYLSLTINEIGTGSSGLYYKWIEDSYGYRTLLATDQLSDADIVIKYNSGDISQERLVASTSSGYITETYVGVKDASIEGGVIYNKNNSNSISLTGDFVFNSISASNTTGYGGVLYNYSSEISSIESNFIANYSYSKSAMIYGGLIYNYKGTIGSIKSDFIANYTYNANSTIYGGIISSRSSTKIDSITGDFIGNYAISGSAIYGSVIHNDTSEIGSITGDFIDNYGYVTGSSYAYGLIYNTKGSIGSISGDFVGNILTSTSSNARGGAIYNYTNSTSYDATIGSIESNFISNSLNAGTSSTTATALGGAIATYATTATTTIDSIDGSFISNSATGSIAQGGAIGTYITTGTNTIGSIDGDFISNSATGTTAQGGAIYTYATTGTNDIDSIEGNFISNSATGSTTSQGGAVYLENSSVAFKASADTSYSYIGNYATTSSNGVPTSDDDENGGFLYSFGGTVEFNTASNSSITIGNGKAGYDSIAGDGTITKTGVGTLTVNSSMEFFTGTLNVEAGTMDISNTLGASEISIGTTDSAATLSLTVNTSGGNTLTSGTLSTISFNNTNSVLKLITTTTTAGDYALSSNSAFSIGDDYLNNVITYGGTFDGEYFTVAAAIVYSDGALTVEGSSNVTIAGESSASDVIISTSSVYDTDTTAITISSASEITTDITADGDSNVIYTAISSEVQSDFTVLSSWEFEISFNDSDDSVVVSFLVGEGLDLSTISLYHTDSDDYTTNVTSSIISYEDGYLSFDANSFSSYTAIAVPEPSTYAMIFGALALGLAMYRRRK